MPVTTPKAVLWKAIRAKCLDCNAGSFIEILKCTVTECSLYPHRLHGTTKGKLEKAQREEEAEAKKLLEQDKLAEKEWNATHHNPVPDAKPKPQFWKKQA